jgi:hypothetical protein
MAETECLTIYAEDIATILGMHITTVYRNPELRAMSRKVGRRVFWIRKEFEAWLFRAPVGD